MPDGPKLTLYDYADQLGEQGWEMVSATPPLPSSSAANPYAMSTGGVYRLVFKRVKH